MNRLRSIAALTLLAGALHSPALAGESVFTSIKSDDCRTVEMDEESASSEQVCPGVKGVELYVDDGDARMSIGLSPDRTFRTFVSFNSVGDQAEWRVDANGDPYAVIVPFTLEVPNEDGSNRPVQLLVVHSHRKADDPAQGGCITAIVNAGENDEARSLARGAADMSGWFDCRETQPVIVGRDPTGIAKSLE